MAIPLTQLVAVFDTSPLIFLDVLDYLSVLPGLYVGLYAPAVAVELLAKPWEPGFRSLGILSQREPSASSLQQVRQELTAGAGETESLALALDLACLVVLDDRAARRFAQGKNLQVVGTLGVVRRIHARQLHQRDLAEELDILLSAGMRLSPEVINKFLA